MSRLYIKTQSEPQAVVEQLYRSVEQRIAASPPGLCPIDMALNFLNLCHAQTCGKCVPCRIGLGQLSEMLQRVLDGEASMHILHQIHVTAQVIVDTADCAIGVNAAQLVLQGLQGFRDDYEEHILHHRCLGALHTPVPCVALCPAGVDIPGYISLINSGRCDDAIRLIRKDNPMPLACGYICDHPCEARCRRSMVDDPINIRGLKRYAADHAGEVPQPKCAPSTGKKIAVVGGGPGGLSAAYYLALMGHKVTIYEHHRQLGGMMRYGIPDYRLPREKMDAEIRSILTLGIEVKTEINVGTDITFSKLKQDYDCLYLSIGANSDKKLGIEGEDGCHGVVSAVELLKHIGDNEMPDFTGQRIVVVGGGNVAMDVTRSAIRLGAKKVTCVYRRRQEDMTAQKEEIVGAIAEGAEVQTLQVPIRIEADEKGNVAALWTQPQIIGEKDSRGRPRPKTADVPQKRIAADIVVVAIGQGIETAGFEQTGIKIQRSGTLLANSNTEMPEMEGVFAGGDCVTGPATVIQAIAAGKVAAANIDEYLGFHHEIKAEVEVPTPRFYDMRPRGRIDVTMREASERKCDFECIECGMTDEEAKQESSRCLRCDHFGYGNFKGGREKQW